MVAKKPRTRSSAADGHASGGASRGPATTRRLPVFTVDLDAPPRQRWRAAARAFTPQLRALAQNLEGGAAAVGKAGMRDVVALWEATMRRCGTAHVIDELNGIAAAAGVKRDLLILGQLEYEMAVAGCTSVLMRTPDGVVLCRTLDWTADLGALAAEVHFVRGGAPVAVTPTIIGFVGCVNGRSCRASGAFSIALNHRPEAGDKDLKSEKQIQRALKRRYQEQMQRFRQPQAWPVATLLREVLLNEKSYAAAVARLSDTVLVAPAYFVVAGAQDGAVVTKSPSTTGASVARLGDAMWASAVQCNHDASNEGYIAADSRERYHAAVAHLRRPPRSLFARVQRLGVPRTRLARAGVKLHLHRLVTRRPVCFPDTLFYTYDRPAGGSGYVRGLLCPAGDEEEEEEKKPRRVQRAAEAPHAKLGRHPVAPAVHVRAAFFSSGGQARNPQRAPLAEMKAAQLGAGGRGPGLLEWRGLETSNAWDHLHGGHFDWWMFPIDDGSRPQYNVYAGDVQELRGDAAYMRNYREGVRLALAAWGWDVGRVAPINPQQPGMGWTHWDVRLAKICRSLWLFEEEKYLKSCQAFARSVKPGGGFRYGGIDLDELLYFTLPR